MNASLLFISLQVALGYWSMLLLAPTYYSFTWPIFLGDIIFFSIAHLISAYYLRDFYRAFQSQSIEQNRWKPNWRMITLLVFALVIYLLKSRHFFLDDDEYYQSFGAVDSSPFYAAIQQHQQPIDYAITRLWSALLGINFFSIRLPHALIAFNCLLAFFYTLVCNKVERKLAYLVTIAFSLSYSYIRFSHESRPQILSFLAAILFVYFFYRNLEKQERAGLFSSCFLFLTSIGLQPQIFLSCFFLCFIPIYRPSYSKIKSIITPIFLACVPALYCSWTVVKFGPPRMRTGGFPFLAALHTLTNNDLFTVFLVPKYWGIALILLVILNLIFLARKLIALDKFPFFLAAVWLIFPPTYYFIFHWLLAPLFSDRYFALWVVPLWLALGIFANGIFLRTKQSYFSLAVLSLVFLVPLSLEDGLATDIDIVHRQDAAGIYQELSKIVQPGDWVVSAVIHYYCIDDGLQFELLLHKNSFSGEYFPTTIHLAEARLEKRQPKKLFFVFLPYAENLPALASDLASIPNLRKVETHSYSYIVYEYLFANDSTFSVEFIQTLQSKVLSKHANSRFQGLALEMTNQIIQGKFKIGGSLWDSIDREIKKIHEGDVSEEWLKLNKQLH